MKEINKKYSNIVLVKNGSMKQRLEMKKATHSLDLGVPKNDSVYKPNLGRMKSMNNYNSKKVEYLKEQGRDYKSESLKINIKMKDKQLPDTTLQLKRFYKDIKMHKENGDLGSTTEILEKANLNFKTIIGNGENEKSINDEAELLYNLENDQFDRWRKIYESRKKLKP